MHHLCLVIFPVIMGCEAIKYILRPILPKKGMVYNFEVEGFSLEVNPMWEK